MRQRDPRPGDASGPGAPKAGAAVEFYAGYRGDETPRAVVIDGAWSRIAEVLSRQRVLDKDGGPILEVWRCRLDDGRVVAVERPEDGNWRVSAA